MDTRQNYPGNQEMQGRQPEGRHLEGHHPESPCAEKDTPTGKCIHAARQLYCTNLRIAKGDKKSSGKAYGRSLKVYQKKKKLFEWTEKNYRLYRNLDICVDSELTAVSTSLTANVKSYATIATTLQTDLKSIVAKITDLKAKVGLLGDQAYNLDKYKNDQANATQWTLLTGKTMENCKPEHEPPHFHRPEACHDADKIYGELITIPKKVLIPDVNSLLMSANDVTGIQTFTNVDTLTAQQTDLSAAATALVTQIQTTATTRQKDLATVQADLITTVQASAAAGVDKYTKGSIAHAAHCTIQFLCCPDCDCVKPWRPDNHEARLVDCECRICKIGDKIRLTYCGGEGDPDEDCGCGKKEQPL
jgi:hypothetical protein